MKSVRPILIGSVAFAFTTVVLALAYAANTLWFVSPTAASANPTRAALISTDISKQAAQATVPAAATLTPSATFTAVPSDTPTVTPPPPVAPPTPPPVSSAAFRQGMTLRADGDYAHAADSFRAVLKENPSAALEREAQFRLGESLWLAGDNANAVRELTALLAAGDSDNFAARAHYFLGQVLRDQRNFNGALDHLRAYRKQTRALQGEIDGAIGAILFALGNGAAAVDQYNTALKDTTLTVVQRVDILEKLSDALKKVGQPAQAAARLGDAYAIAPDYATAARLEYKWGLALDAAGQHSAAVTRWRHTIAAYPDQDDAYNALVALVNAGETVDDFQRGLVDAYYGSDDAAISAFNRFIKANPGRNAAAYYYLGKAYMHNGQDALGARAFDNLLTNYPADKLAADAAWFKAKALTNTGDTTAGVAAYNWFAAKFPTDSRAPDALYQAARNLDVDDRTDEARAQYQKLINAYPGNKNSSTALFNIGLDYYFNKGTALAEETWQALAKKYPNTTDADHALFWLGKLAQGRGDNAAAQDFFQEAAKPPRSYYSYRSLDQLAPASKPASYDVTAYDMNAQTNAAAEFEQWLAGRLGAPVSSDLSAAVAADFNFRRGSELAQLDQWAAARPDFEKVYARFKGDARALYGLARYFQENSFYDLSIRAALQIQALARASDDTTPRYLRELIYPTYYADLVVPYAQRYGFDPALFFALMRQESMYDATAKSWVGASGLTQVMPGTGRGIARELGVTNFKQADLLKPYVSVRFGTYYFGQLYKTFSGNPFYSLAGYNAGPGNAKRWARPDVDTAIEIINLAETYNYVRTIYSQYNQYVEIYRGR